MVSIIQRIERLCAMQGFSMLKRRKIGERLNKVIDIYAQCDYNDE